MPSQVERSTATRTALLGVARALFAERGYADTPTEEVVERAGLTRGALYHHFRNKEDLFRAVVEEVERGIAGKVSLGALRHAEPWDQLVAGCAAFLDVCMEPEVQRIALLDGPSVLGWEEYREIDARHGLGLLIGSLQANMDAGSIDRQPVEPLAHVVLGALLEGSMFIARAANPAHARRDVGGAIERLLEGLRARPSAKGSGSRATRRR